MKFFTVYENPDVLSINDFVFVKNGFSIFALIFPILYSIWNGLWKASLIFFLYYLILFYLFYRFDFLGPIIFILFFMGHMVFSFEAKEFKQNKLINKGWRKAGFVSGNNITDAEIKFYSLQFKLKTNKD